MNSLQLLVVFFGAVCPAVALQSVMTRMQPARTPTCTAGTKYPYTCVKSPDAPSAPEWMNWGYHTADECAAACGEMGFSYSIYVRDGNNCRCTNYNSKQAGTNCCDCYQVVCEGDPTPAPPTPQTCDSAGVEHPVAPHGRCFAWGDPHYLERFIGGREDFMGLGAYLLATTIDGCFEVQAWQCQVGSARVATFAGFAIKVGGRTVQIVDKKVYVEGNETSEADYPEDILMRGTPRGNNFEMSLCNCGNTTGTVGWLKAKHTAGAAYGISGYLDIELEIVNSVLAQKGICAADPASAAIACGNSLFTEAQINTLSAACGHGCPPPPLEPPPTPEEACSEAGIDFSVAQAACSGQLPDFMDVCITDYCGSDGDDIFVEDLPKTPSPPSTSVPTPPPTPSPPTPSPPTQSPTSPPTAPPTEGGDVPECTNCGSRPLECWDTCGGKKGYCSACDSVSGRQGACCYQAGPSGPPAPPGDQDPDECSTVDPSQFLYTGYHICVLTNP